MTGSKNTDQGEDPVSKNAFSKKKSRGERRRKLHYSDLNQVHRSKERQEAGEKVSHRRGGCQEDAKEKGRVTAPEGCAAKKGKLQPDRERSKRRERS